MKRSPAEATRSLIDSVHGGPARLNSRTISRVPVNTSAVNVSLANGADPNARDAYGMTVLMRAVDVPSPAAVEKLIAAGAKVNARGGYPLIGRTALMIACQKGDVNMVRRLIEAGANLNMRDSNGETALMRGVEHPRVLKTLLLYGADANITDNSGTTVLQHARDFRLRASVNMLTTFPATLNKSARVIQRSFRGYQQRLQAERARLRRQRNQLHSELRALPPGVISRSFRYI